jgi:drug/metabolite transporter (DMT)-like permease
MRARDLAMLVGLAAIWGLSYLFIRVAVVPLGPLVVAFLRVVVAGCGLAAFALLAGRRGEIPPLDRRFLVLGIANAAIPYAAISFAELHITASMAAILNATTPLFAAVVAASWDRERLATRTLVGIVLGFAGVAVLVGWNPTPVDGWFSLAVAAMLGASLAYGFATVYARRTLRNVTSFGAATGQQIGAAVALLPFALTSAALGDADPTPGRPAVLAILGLGLLCTSLAYLLYFRLIATVGPVRTASVTFLIPIFGIGWSALFLGEAIRPSMLAGLAIILASVVLVGGVRPPRWLREGVPALRPGG